MSNKKKMIVKSLNCIETLRTFAAEIDECAEKIDNCHEYADCTNTDGSFTCKCYPGFRGDGVWDCDGKSCQLEI